MTQRQGPSGHDTHDPRRYGAEDDPRRHRSARERDDESWMHDKERQAQRVGQADYAYDPARARGREYGHASADDYGRGGHSRDYAAGDEYGSAERGGERGARTQRDHGRGWREDGAPGRERGLREVYARESGERGLYGAHGPGVRARGPGDDEYRDRDRDWRAGGFDERSQSLGWEDDRGDAPGGSPRQGDPSHGYYIYGGDNAGRARLHDYDEFDPRRGRYDEDYRAGGRHMGEGYGRSSGYAAGDFADSAYGAGFEPNREPARHSASGSPSGYRDPGARSHRGRGPRGYTRSDQRIEEDLNERLTEDALVDASDIEVSCSQGKVVLTGEVDDRWMKHRAEDIADACGGVKDVDNRISVRRRAYAQETSERQSAGRFGQVPSAPSSSAQSSPAHGSPAQSTPAQSTPAHSAATQNPSAPPSAGQAEAARSGADASPGTGTRGASPAAGGSPQAH